MLSVKQGGIKYRLVFGMIRPGIEPRSPEPLANTLTINKPIQYIVSDCVDSVFVIVFLQ